MKYNLLLIDLLFSLAVLAQNKTIEKKIGWLVYFGDKVIWYDANTKRCPGSDKFFTSDQKYEDGLIVNYSETAPFYKSVATGYRIKAKYIDPQKKTPINSQLDSVWVVPAKARYQIVDTSKNEYPIGKHYIIGWGNKDVSIYYNITSGYLVTDIELCRKRDKKKYKAIKSYEIYPPH